MFENHSFYNFKTKNMFEFLRQKWSKLHLQITLLILGAKILIFLLRKLMLKNKWFLVKVIKEKYNFAPKLKNETLLVIFKHCDIIVHKLCSILQGHSHTQSQLWNRTQGIRKARKRKKLAWFTRTNTDWQTINNLTACSIRGKWNVSWNWFTTYLGLFVRIFKS